MINKCVTRALNCFLESKRATVTELFDDLDRAEKAPALEEYFHLKPDQQEAVVHFLTNETVRRATCGFFCHLAIQADENEAVLLPDNLFAAIDRYNKTCSVVFGTVDPAQTMALLSIEGLLGTIGFEPPCLLLVNKKLPKLAFYGYLYGVSGNDGPVADVLLDNYGLEFDKSFNDFRDLDIPEQVIDALITADKNRGRGNWILTRILFACEKLNDKTLVKITDHLFSPNDISPMQVSLISASSDKMNTQRILAYVEPLYRESILAGNPQFFYLYAALKIAQCREFMSTNAVKTICVSEDTCEISLALGQLSLNAIAVLYNAGTMMGFHSGVTVTAELSNRILELLSDEDGSLYYAAQTCLRDLVAIQQFDNGLLRESKVVHKAIENLRSPVVIIERAAEIVLGMMPFTSVRLLPSSLARRFFSYYKRAMRCEEYDWRLVLYFRALVSCGAWRQQLVPHYKQVYEYYIQHAGEMSREEEILLQLTRQELPKIDKALMKNRGTDLDVLKHSLEMPSIFDVCDLSCKADRLEAAPNARITFTAKESQVVIVLAMREKLGMQTKHINAKQIKTLLSRGDLPEGEGVGSFLVVQWFQWLCSYDCGAVAVAFYTQYKHLLDRPCFYPEDEWKCTFTKVAEFLGLPSRVEMAIAEALMCGSTTVAQLFASQPYAPASLPESTRETIADMLEKRKNWELPVAEGILTDWLDLGPNLMSMPAKAWTRFYDDQGVAQLAVRENTRCHEAVLEFGYGVNEGVAAAALRKDPLWCLNYIAASLQSSEVILQALQDGVKNFAAEES